MNENQKKNELSHIHLIGNAEENFYSLGNKDKDGFIYIYDQITQLCTRSPYLAKAIKIASEWSVNYEKRGNIDLSREMSAYAQGLERPVNDVYFTMLLPEVVASFNKWLPNLLNIVPGCSSLFVHDKKNDGVIHSRILDYALAGPFENFERSIFYEFTNRFKTFSYSTVGMPFASLTSMNEKGLTLALHYKHGEYFDIKGDSIFFIAHQIISYCSNVHEVKKYLKAHPSIGYWGLYTSDTNGNVASFDICGNEIYQEKFDISEHKYLYFNNRPLLKDKHDESLQPYGNQQQCLMRYNSIKKKMKNFNYQSKDIDLEILKTIGTNTYIKADTAEKWEMGTITPSSLQVLTLNNKTNESLFIPGASPKIFTGEYLKFSDITTSPSQEYKKIKTKYEVNYVLGQQAMSLAQSCIDRAEIEKAYHNIQMAIEYFNGHAEAYICKFYFTVWEYIYSEGSKDFSYIYEDLLDLEGKLPPYLNDHRLLFIMRLNKILNLGQENAIGAQIQSEQLQNIFYKEIKMKAMALKLMRKFTFPRIEILDIIYAYS